MTAPKPGDQLTTEQVDALPEGAVYSETINYTVGVAGHEQHVGPFVTYGLVSLPTPPDMAPGSVVLDDEGRAWVCSSGDFWYGTIPGAPVTGWSGLAPSVVRVLHDAANPEGAS